MLIQEKKMLSTPCSRVCGDRRGSHSATPAPARQAVPIRSAGRNAELECGRSADDLSPGGLAGAQGQGQGVFLCADLSLAGLSDTGGVQMEWTQPLPQESQDRRTRLINEGRIQYARYDGRNRLGQADVSCTWH